MSLYLFILPVSLPDSVYFTCVFTCNAGCDRPVWVYFTCLFSCLFYLSIYLFILPVYLPVIQDVTDLFGADLPVEGEEGGRFAWRDGPLLRALKLGHWVVLDEVRESAGIFCLPLAVNGM